MYIVITFNCQVVCFSHPPPNSIGKLIQRLGNKAVTQGAWLPEAPKLGARRHKFCSRSLSGHLNMEFLFLSNLSNKHLVKKSTSLMLK